MAHKEACICDRCNKGIAVDGGYLVWSEASTAYAGGVGVMLICEECANQVFTEEMWKQTRPTGREFQPSGDSLAEIAASMKGFTDKLMHANDFSVATRAKRRGLEPVEARQEARELAQLWWTNESVALKRLRAQRKR